MKTFIVTRQVIYNQSLEVEAESEYEAIEKAKDIPYSSEDKTFLDTDYYEIVDEYELDDVQHEELK